MTIQVLLFDVLGGGGRPRTIRTVSVLSNFSDQRFQSTRLQFLLGNILSNCYAPYSLFSCKDFIN